MGPAIFGALAARRVQAAREQEVFMQGQRQRDARDRERQKKEKEYERALRRQEEEEERAVRKRLEAWFEKYDTDASGLLEHGELRQFLADLMPNELAPSDEAIEALLASFPAGIGVNEVLKASLRYEAYVQDKKRLDDAFAVLDVDGSGLLERQEIVRVMADLVPALGAVTESDLNFVYDALPNHVRGEPVPRELMGALLPACASWAKHAKKAAAAAESVGEVGGSKSSSSSRSNVCTLL